MTTTTAPTLPRTAARSHQLVAASQRTTLDPFEYVDWSVPIDDSAFHLPPELLPLYGTAAWDAMSDTEQIAYSRHETAALCGAGVWFENVLMQVVLRHLADMPVTDPRIATSSSRWPTNAGTRPCSASTSGAPAPPRTVRRSARARCRTTIRRRAVSYLLILAVEELLDHMNRATMRDERVHPTSRAMAKLHVLEEARHVSFAKTYLAESWETLDDAARREIADAAPMLVSVVADLSVDPAVYEHLGIVDGAEMARANPNHRTTIVAGLAKLTTFLTEIGVIDQEHRSTWVELGLVD